ncbi:molybdopterin-dependent oxidoreductase [Adlercreutzia agrestimuris]|uniref:molybdopterin-dependent oxidoreductase n=1 Tax=Adlercreutzia agrestimuris TaxID=2941324 RepID=UPI002040E50E|nr:molybdopterin-dependent oxidoreductase [Adlercreutzia agrestimuris]
MKELSLKDTRLSRRAFIAACAASAAAFEVADSHFGRDSRLAFADKKDLADSEAEWKTIACLHGCGTRCMNQTLVKDGIPIRQKTDDTHPDSILYPQQRGCLRGRALVEFENGADRLKYPMKRISWSLDDPHGELRGKEGYVRISWDEALDLVSEQLKRTYKEHGPRAVYIPCNISGGRKYVAPLLNTLGGYLTVSDSISYGSYTLNADALGITYGGECGGNDRLDMIENADTVVLFGQNPGWGSNGNPAYFFRAAKDNGANFIYVGPSYNVSAAMLDARWIPVKPGTDTAFLLGVAHSMLKLDKEKGDIIDWDFLHKYCIGFDAESMPKNAKTSENFRGYLEGSYDGEVKDAAWASTICGTPEEDIMWFAEEMSKQKNVTLSHGYSAARCTGAEDIPQAYMTIACMGGHYGKPGNACSNYWVDRQGPVGFQIISTGDDGTADITLPDLDPLYDADEFEPVDETDYVQALQIWDAIIDGKYTSTGRCWSGNFTEPQEKECDIRIIYAARDGSARSVTNGSKAAEAYRKLDFILYQHFVPSPSTPYADIILPVTSDIERNAIAENGDRDREMVLVYSKMGGDTYEAKTDQWIAEQILERLGYNPKDVYPLTEDQMFFNQLKNTKIEYADGTSSPLVTITEQDIKEWGVEGEPQTGEIGINELVKQGIYQVERHFGDQYQTITYADYIENPEENPLDSESGKFEIYCQAKADTFNMATLTNEEYKPYPTYHALVQDENYPLLMFNTHYPRSACTDFNNVETLRETFLAPVVMNSQDAEARGIQSGDAVLITSPHGKILRPVSVSELIVPGSIDVPNGSWPSFDEDGIDRGGNPNTLYGGNPQGMGVSGYNNVAVQAEKWTGAPLQPDYETRLTLDIEE